MNLANLATKAKKEIQAAADLKTLDTVFKKYLGRKGELTLILRSLKDLPEKERRKKGKEANMLRKELQDIFEKRAEELRKLAEKEAAIAQGIDVTAPGVKLERGNLHPITLVIRQTVNIFQQMGFSVVLGPEIETEWYNFDALNIPSEHPARDLWNTLWLKSAGGTSSVATSKKPRATSHELLLRTHTSSVQIRYMEQNDPPLRIIVPGRVFRREATDASHEVNFYQLEGLMVDKNVSVANFKAIIQEFFQRFFARPPRELPGAGTTDRIQIRLRPSYFPFVEPGFEVDTSCIQCAKSQITNHKSQTNPKSKTLNSKAECSVCHGSGWLEMMGAGMVHPAVFKAVKYNPKDWTGFAFGMGLDRLAMMKYKINDIRLFYSGDLRFLKQF